MDVERGKNSGSSAAQTCLPAAPERSAAAQPSESQAFPSNWVGQKNGDWLGCFTSPALLHLVQSGVDNQSRQDEKSNSGSRAQHFHQGIDLVHLGHQLALLRRHLRGRLVEK